MLSGGVSRDELISAGAAEVYRDPADLLAALPASLLGRSGLSGPCPDGGNSLIVASVSC